MFVLPAFLWVQHLNKPQIFLSMPQNKCKIRILNTLITPSSLLHHKNLLHGRLLKPDHQGKHCQVSFTNMPKCQQISECENTWIFKEMYHVWEYFLMYTKTLKGQWVCPHTLTYISGVKGMACTRYTDAI